MLKFKWSYLPPMLIYASAGVSGITSIVGIFFLKDYLALSAAFIASIGFWAGIPWALKMPIGFLIDRYWNYKHYFVYIGALFISASLIIMYRILLYRDQMEEYLYIETWFIISAILTPIGYVFQDVVADAMTVEIVEPNFKANAKKVNSKNIKAEHTLVQLYGRFAIILGALLVGLINLYVFNDLADKKNDLNEIYANIYLFALIIPIISVSGVFFSRIKNKNTI